MDYKKNHNRKPNHCVVCRAILHELGSMQYHKRLKVNDGVAGLPTASV